MRTNSTTPTQPYGSPFFSQRPYNPRPAQGNGVGPRAW